MTISTLCFLIGAALLSGWCVFELIGRLRPAHVCFTCGYNLTGITSQQCPECGEDVNTARRRRRSYKRAALAGVLGLASAIVAFRAPLSHALWTLISARFLVRQSPVQPSGSNGWQRLLFNELHDRLYRGAVSCDDSEVLIRRQLQWHKDAGTLLVARTAWPRTLPIAIELMSLRQLTTTCPFIMHLFEPSLQWDTTIAIPTVSSYHMNREFDPNSTSNAMFSIPTACVQGGQLQLIYDVAPELNTNRQPLKQRLVSPTSQRIIIPMRLVDSVDDVLTAVHSSELDATLARDLRFMLRRYNDEWLLWVDLDTTLAAGDLSIGLRLTVKAGEVVIGVARISCYRGLPVGDRALFWSIVTVGTEKSDLIGWHDAKLAISVESDPEMAMRDFEGSRYWVGAFESAVELSAN